MTQTHVGAGNAADKLFNGYDNVANGMLNASAVTGDRVEGGGRSVVNIRVCESLTELAKALEIDASLSVSYLKAVNVTAKMKFMQKLDATARSISIVVYASHESGTWSVKNVRLAPSVKAPASDDEAADFAGSYGDSYVSEATQGGEYYAVYTFRTETQTEQRELTASLKAKGIYTGIKAETDVQTKLSDFLKSTTTSWTFDQEITGHANPVLPSEDKLIEFARTFSSKPLDSPVTTNFRVSGYETVPGINRRKFARIADNRDYFVGAEGLLHDYSRLQAVRNQIGWLRRIYARYGYTADTALLAFEGEVKADISKIDRQITAYRRDPAADFERPKLSSLDKGEPVLDYAAGQPISFGGDGGGPFDFMRVGEALRNQVKISSVRFAEKDGVIRRIEIGYSSDRTSWTEKHGGEGIWRETFYLEEGQFPVRFEIRSGSYIDKISIYANDGRETWAGGGGGGLTEWKVPAGSVVLGFAGREGLALDQIKIVHAALKPARYVQAQ